MRITNGGARKKEWEYIITNKKPMYVNTKKNLEHPIFLNKNGRPSYRNIHGVMMRVKDYPKKYVPLLNKETLKISEGDKKSIKKTMKKLILKKKTAAPRPKTPTKETRVDSKIPPSFFGSPRKRSPTSIKLSEYIEKLKRNEVLPKNKTVKQLTTFCKLADKKLNTMSLNPKANTFNPKAKTPTPKAKTSKLPNSFFDISSPTPKAKTPTPKAKTPTPKAKTPTPKAKTPTPKEKPLLLKQKLVLP